MIPDYGIALYAGAVILLGDSFAEAVSIRWRWRGARPLLRTIVAVAILVVGYFLWLK